MTKHLKNLIVKAIHFLVLCGFVGILDRTCPNSRAGETGTEPPALLTPRSDVLYTTNEAYHDAALKQLVQEANEVAKELQLPEELPITESNIVNSYICNPERARFNSAIGMIITRNYYYSVSKNYKLCYCDNLFQDRERLAWSEKYRLPISQLDTNGAYAAATNMLSAVSMDVTALNKNCELHVTASVTGDQPGKDTLVPIYWVYWTRNGVKGSVASVRLFLPTRKLLSLRVEDPAYNLRKPLVITTNSTAAAPE